MSWFEKKFGKYAIQNLTIILIACYIVGYVLEFTNPALVSYLTLDPYKILHGQIWRIFTWVLIPPEGLDWFTIIMLYFYYNLGTTLERTWGTYRYNVYLFSGMLFTIIGSFLCLGVLYLMFGNEVEILLSSGILTQYFALFSTYYINLSIFMAFAVTYPDMQVLLMFVIPVKMKWMGILDAVILGMQLLQYGNCVVFGNASGDVGLFVYGLFGAVSILACMLNFFLFFLSTRNLRRMAPKQVKRRAEFRQQVKKNPAPHGHKCAICGRTDEDDPTLEFRYCSKCNGNFEYCQHHLFTHEHVK